MKATVGKPLTLNCPSHGPTYNEVYSWGRFHGGRRILFLSNFEDRLVLDGRNGTLVFPYVKRDDIIKVEKLGGIQCRIYIYGAGKFLTSHRLFLKESGKGTREALHIGSDYHIIK